MIVIGHFGSIRALKSMKNLITVMRIISFALSKGKGTYSVRLIK